MRIQSRERGAGIRQNSGQSERFMLEAALLARRSKLLARRGVSPCGVSGVTARSRGPAARFARGSESVSQGIAMRIQPELCIPRPQLVMKAGPRALRYAFRAANGAPEFARIPARVSGQPQVPARPARRSKLLAHPGASPRGVSGVTARSRGPAARFARGSESVYQGIAMRIQNREPAAEPR